MLPAGAQPKRLSLHAGINPDRQEERPSHGRARQLIRMYPPRRTAAYSLRRWSGEMQLGGGEKKITEIFKEAFWKTFGPFVPSCLSLSFPPPLPVIYGECLWIIHSTKAPLHQR